MTAEITKRKDDEYGRLVYRVSGVGYRCLIRAVDFSDVNTPEQDVSYTVWGLEGYYHPCTPYSGPAGQQLYHGGSLDEAWETIRRKTGAQKLPPPRLQEFHDTATKQEQTTHG